MLTGARHVPRLVPFRTCHLHATPRNLVQVAEDSWRTGAGDYQIRPKSGIASDQVVLSSTREPKAVFSLVLPWQRRIMFANYLP